MRIGLVRFVNARPLDHGLRLQAQQDASLRLFEDTPARLYARLAAGELDAALISSVECLRNPDRFGYCDQVGICAHNEVFSILYIEPRSENTNSQSSAKTQLRPQAAPQRILADDGSRSSIALLQILCQREWQSKAPIVSTPPEEIPDRLQPGEGGLIIGDAAIAFRNQAIADRFLITDLGQWWHSLEELPFVFGLWAYPIDRPIADDFFLSSLTQGENQIEEIIATNAASERSRDHPLYTNPDQLREYLTRYLHYRMQDQDRLALQRFKELLPGADSL